VGCYVYASHESIQRPMFIIIGGHKHTTLHATLLEYKIAMMNINDGIQQHSIPH